MHQPVLVKEVVDNLVTENSRIIVDATVGTGGHAEAILSRHPVELIGIDQDLSALKISQKRLALYKDRIGLAQLRFSQIEEYLSGLKIKDISGFLFDLGLSSLQLDTPERGFSFQTEGPLDMRMDQSQSKNAFEVVNHYPVMQLTRILFQYGQEKFSKRIARAIEHRRNKAPISTTSELKEVVESVIYPPFRIKSLARVFQAIRIEVNDEINQLKEGLNQAIRLLTPGGRLCAISYHSLEHQLIKRKLKNESRGCICPPRLPVCACGARTTLRVLTPRPLAPSPEEKQSNHRSRSARLWVAEKLEPSSL
jgi:16S rRNA (cytosine1402-N4)-methyltransferase